MDSWQQSVPEGMNTKLEHLAVSTTQLLVVNMQVPLCLPESKELVYFSCHIRWLVKGY